MASEMDGTVNGNTRELLYVSRIASLVKVFYRVSVLHCSRKTTQFQLQGQQPSCVAELFGCTCCNNFVLAIANPALGPM
jgi:hypothetical protein